MPATATTIWRVPLYLPHLQPPLNPTRIREAEAQIGHSLPSELVALLEVQNGGYIRYELPTLPHRRIAGIGPRFPSLAAVDWEDVQDDVGFELDGLVPFDGDGHWHLCLDYRNRVAEPLVTYVDIECNSEEPVASSFAEYLTRLQLKIPDGYLLTSGHDIDALKAGLTSALGCRFEPSSSETYGYPVHRARIEVESADGWVWLNSNEVPRGFVREGTGSDFERQFPASDLVPQYPEVPRNAVLMKLSDEIRQPVLEACRAAGLEVRSMREFFPNELAP